MPIAKKTNNNFTLRLPTPDRRLIEAAAAQKGEPLAAFIRQVALRAARRELELGNGAGR